MFGNLDQILFVLSPMDFILCEFQLLCDGLHSDSLLCSIELFVDGLLEAGLRQAHICLRHLGLRQLDRLAVVTGNHHGSLALIKIRAH